jgi:chaperone BCS1
MILKRLTEECRVEYLANSENQTTIYENGNDGWIKDKEVTARPLSTVILHEQQKELLVHDLRRFLDPKTKHRYSTHSIPYKRGYLLYGPPGTGKTSFSLSIAGEADMDIYVINMHSIDDWKLKTLFRSLPKKCVVLLEDIDAAGATCSRSFNPDGPESEREKRSQKKAVTLSGLLNALDGVSSQEDRVLIMTTNHPEKLDDALTRPGRVDLKIAFQLANRSMAKDIYRFMFKESEYDYGDVNQQGNHDEAVKKQRDHDEMVEEQAEAFAAKVPESEFSPAEIMAHLQQHWSSPADAVKHCGQWVHDLLKEKKAKKATSG